ncbi:MAG: polysaccharide biosynthesis C-terminal domain-containing protein [Gaiellaceae bacterium]
MIGAEGPGSPRLKGRFGANVGRLYAGQVAFSLIALAGSLLTARLLGPTGRGDLSILILLPTLFTVALEFGLESANSHLVAGKPEIRRSLQQAATAYACLIVLPGAALTALALQLLDFDSGSIIKAASAGGIAIGASVYVRSMAGLALGLNRVSLYNGSRLLLALSFPIPVSILAAFGDRSAVHFFYAWCLGTAAVAIVFALLLDACMPRLQIESIRQHVAVTLPIHLSNVSQFLLLRADQLLLFALAGSAAVGYYAVAVNIVEVLWYLPSVAGVVSLPLLSGDGSHAEKSEMLLYALRLSIWLAALGGALCALTAPLVVPLLFGPAFAPTVFPLEILLPGIVAGGVIRVGTAALIACGKLNHLLRVTLLALGVNILLAVLMIPFWGAAGAAAASTVSYMLLAALLLRAVTGAWSISMIACLRCPFTLAQMRRLVSRVA